MTLSFEQIRDLVRAALNPTDAAGNRPAGQPYLYVEEMFSDQVIYSNDKDLFQRSYAVTDSKVTLGEEKKVQRKVTYEPLTAACQFLTAVDGDETGNLWHVCILKYGLHDGRLLFTKEKMTAAVAKFDGAKLFALRSGQHQDASKYGKPPVDIIGVLTKPEAKEDGIYGQVAFLPTGYGIRDNLKAAREMGVNDPYGLSVDIDAKAAVLKLKGKQVLAPLEINKISVDVVYDPAAGGGFLQMAAAVQAGREEEEMFQKLLAALQVNRPDLFVQITAAIGAGTMTEDEALTQIAAATVKDADGDTANTQLVAAVTAQLQQLVAGLQPNADVNHNTQLMACDIRLTQALTDSDLPRPSQTNLRKMFEGKIFAAAELDSAIKAKKEELDALIGGTGLVIDAGQLRAAHITDQRDKLDIMLDDFFAGKMSSFKACYQQITGDTLVTGRVRDAVHLQASIQSGTFAEFLGDSITRRALAEYNTSGLSAWQDICDIVPLGDFRTQHRPRMGGYGDLPIVEERGAYEPLDTPADEEATYAPAKRGGTEDITLEAIKNDDVGLIRKVPVKLGRSAARTLYKFVFAFLDGNPVVFDGTALFHADHGNLGSAALDATALKARRLAMMKQTEAGSLEPLGLVPRHLIVPADLEDTAYALTVQPNLGGFTPTAADAIRRQSWNIIAVKHWLDATNWYLGADKADCPLIEIGFLDGKQEPEFFVQDLPNVGSMFSNDMLTYKIRHIYGGNIMDFRGFDGSVVAG